jgi:hypothetical protein
MTDWRTAMRDTARRDEQDELSPGEADAMRRLVVAAAGQRAETPAASPWLRPMFVVATVAALIAVGTVTAIKTDLSGRSSSALTDTTLPTSTSARNSSAESTVDASSRQLQFSTPGGTRIIWVFNSDLNLKATTR